MSKAIRLHEHGGADKLVWEDVEVPAPGPEEALVRHTAIGLNFSDVYLRTGLYPRPLPSGVGTEAAGVVEAVGKKVKGLKKGDRVVYMFPVPGAYAEQRVLPSGALVKIPAGVKDDAAAALLLKGLTTWYLLRETYKVKKGDTILILAAAGGVGLIMSQWARALGAKVIGQVSSEAKARLAKKAGCHQVLVGLDNLGERVKKLNKGKGVDVVYDGVGKDSFLASLDSLRPRGLMVSFGNASGPVGAITPLELAKRGSLYLTRAGGGDYLADPAARKKGVAELFNLIKKKKIKAHIGQRYALADAAKAQSDLEARATVGSTILVP
ncbi:MAG: quinone oxidoreductase [Steroidobacteraceae bacterium]